MTTVFADKLKDTSIGRQTRLYMLALTMLQRHGNPLTAQRYLADAIQNDLSAIRELCGDDLRVLIERKAHEYLRERAAEKSGRVREERGEEAMGGMPRGHSTSAQTLPRRHIWSPEDIWATRPDRVGRGQGEDALRLSSIASPRDTQDGEGAKASVPNGHGSACLSPSPKAAEAGQSRVVADRTGSAGLGVPRHLPGHARRGAAAIAAVQPTMAKALLHTYRLHDGSLLHTMTFRDAAKLETVYARDALLLKKLRQFAANIPPEATISEMITPDRFESYIAEVEREMADAAA